MSKLVKSVGRAISKVVKGVVNVVKKVVKTVTSSKIGKIILVAAAVYFGGAALSGALSSTAGSSALTGISNAWTSLTTAGSQALAGNFANAASALGTGIQGGAAIAGEAGIIASGMGGTAASFAPVSTMAPTSMGVAATSGAPGAALSPAASNAAFESAVTGLGKTGAGEAAKGFFSSDLAKYGAISAGTQLAGGLIQGAGAQKAQDEQRAYEEQQIAQQRARYEASVRDFSNQANSQAAAGQVIQDRYAPTAYDPVAEAKAIGDRYRAEYEARNPSTGLVARGMQTPQPMTNNNFPIYNPYYYRG